MITLYAAFRDGILTARSQTGGWSASWAQPAEEIECAAVGSGAPQRIFVGTVEAGLVRSTDAGESWERVALAGERVTAISVSSVDPDIVWAGTEPSRVYRSEDGGESWRERSGLTSLPSADRWSFPPRPHTHHVRWIAVHPRDPDRLAVAIEAGALVRTTDGGRTWIDHPEGAPRDSHTIAVHPKAPSRLVVAAGDGYAESPDWGATWTFPEDGLDHRYVWSATLAPTDPDTVFVSAAAGAYAAHDPNGRSYVYRRSNGAWTLAMDGLPGPVGLGRAVLATGPDEVYAATNHALFRWTSDAWVPLPVEVLWRERNELPQGLAVVSGEVS